MKTLNLAQVAQTLKMEAKKAQVLLETGLIEGRRTDGDWEVTQEAVEDYLRGTQESPDPGLMAEKRDNLPKE